MLLAAMSRQTFILTLLALVAFAANSVLCRMALKASLIDPVGFTQVRLLSGAVFLTLLLYRRKGFRAPFRFRHGYAAMALFIYALAFSLAYVEIDAGAGALILFGAVQFTMVGAGLFKGDYPNVPQWTGLVIALTGLTYLLSPGLAAPPLGAAALMAASGVAWGLYSLMGKSAGDPAVTTARNFLLASPLAFLLFLAPGDGQVTLSGAALAAASGAAASGAGYVIWYRALKGLTAINASIVQLAAPALAAFGGVILLNEPITLRLLIASFLILGGIFLAIRYKARTENKL